MSVFFRRRAPVTKSDEHTLLLLHGEELIDSSMYGHTIDNIGVSVSPDQSKFGGKSLYFDGNSHLTVPLTVGGDFTVDFWIYIKQRLSGKTWVCPFHWTNGSSRGLLIYLVDTITYLCASSTNNTHNTVIDTGKWYHIAVVREGSSAKMYLNGSLLLTVSNAAFTGDNLAIGYDSQSPGDTPLCGWIDEFRVSDIARWTSDFVPPTEPYVGTTSGNTSGGDSGDNGDSGDSGNETTITFTVAGVSYTADKGMTWAQYIASSYNTTGFKLVGGGVFTSGNKGVFYQGAHQPSTAAIIANGIYTTG